jgi:alkylhydroperoxidase family enzyme
VQELFSDPELVELTMIMALANFTNRLSNGLAISSEAAPGMG